MGTLLSVDWDFFFPVPYTFDDKEFLYDWGHRETGIFVSGTIWGIRAAQFINTGTPLPQTSGEEISFWSRFRIGSKTSLVIADSHKYAASNPITSHHYDQVINFDAHHDSGYGSPVSDFKFSCEDWTNYYIQRKIPVKVVYPRWKSKFAFVEETLPDQAKEMVERSIDNGQPVPHNISQVFLCRSGAWTPTWLDDKFFSLVKDFPGGKKIMLQSITSRGFDLEEVKRLASNMKKLMTEQGSGRVSVLE